WHPLVMARSRQNPRTSPRIRRTAEEARTAILDAAERQLSEGGPAALRLQQVAADVGISHPTVLHHFGTRELLLQAVVTRSLASLHADVVNAIVNTPPGDERMAMLIERVFEALDRGGHGRALAWLALSGLSPPESEGRLRQVAEAAHAMRRERH